MIKPMNKKYLQFISSVVLVIAFCCIQLNTSFAYAFGNEGDSDCVFCTQVVPQCEPEEILVPQTCEKCAHCANVPVSGTWQGKLKSHKKTLWFFRQKSLLKFNLSVIDNALSGQLLKNKNTGKITDYKVNSPNEITVTVTYDDLSIEEITLKLNEGELFAIFENGKKIRLKKTDDIDTSGSLSNETRISTPDLDVLISEIMAGDLILTDDQEAVLVKAVSKKELKDQKLWRVTFSDAIYLEGTANHLTADGKRFGNLMIGDYVDGRQVIEKNLVPYPYKYVYDILPDSKSASYYANGILVKSTLRGVKSISGRKNWFQRLFSR